MIKFRPMVLEDAKFRVRWLSNPEISRYMRSSVRHGTTIQREEELFKKQVIQEKTRVMFIILDNGLPIGDVGLYDIDLIDKNAMLVIMVGEKACQGKGIGTKALEFIVRYGFEKLGLHKISLQVNADNIPAIKCYRKVGFREEGRLREHAVIGKKYTDEFIMSLFNQ